MEFLDLSLPTPRENLALDEALLLRAEAGQGGETLRLWEWASPVVVLGSACRLAEDVDEPACAAAGVPIVRRSSGGGTVLWGRGCLLYSLVLRFDRDPALAEIRPSYRHILGRVAEALGVPGVEHAGISDLAVGGRKFSGNAQQRKRNHLLHHGTILLDFDLAQVGRYLRPPPRQPEYRAGRAHEEFLCNLALSGEDVRRRLRTAWGAEAQSAGWPTEEVRRLVEQKYALEAWTRRR